MSTASPEAAPATSPRVRRPRPDRLVAGALLVAVGVAWLLDAAGVSVPWRLLPAVALIGVGAVVGVALLLQELGVVAQSWAVVLPLLLVATGTALLATAGSGGGPGSRRVGG